MRFENWFDIYDKNHIEAYRFFCRTGEWPGGFIPNKVQMSSKWRIWLEAKMSKAWIK